MLYILAFIAGAFFGVVFMCLFQINRPEAEKENRREGERHEGS